MKKYLKFPNTFMFFIPLIFFLAYMSIFFPFVVFTSPPELRSNYIVSVLCNIPFVIVPITINAIISYRLFKKLISRQILASKFVVRYLIINCVLLMLSLLFETITMTIIEYDTPASMNISTGFIIALTTTYIMHLVIIVLALYEAQHYSK